MTETKTDDVLDRVGEILVTEFGVAAQDVHPGADLFGDLGLDSLDALKAALLLEDAFGIRVDEREFEHVRLLSEVADMVRTRVESG